jgi:hypothetical protein
MSTLEVSYCEEMNAHYNELAKLGFCPPSKKPRLGEPETTGTDVSSSEIENELFSATLSSAPGAE